MSDGHRSLPTDDSSANAHRPSKSPVSRTRIVTITSLVIAVVGISVWSSLQSGADARNLVYDNVSDDESSNASFIKLWWGDFPRKVRQVSSVPNADASSNIHPEDYVGPEACKRCHQKNYESWSHHPHRWMNALADSSTVKGDFSGAKMSYLGGEATFYQEDGEYQMRLVREDTRIYIVNQTIGSRFFQYYTGKQISGPVQADRMPYLQDHVLPFGFWLEPKEWVPVVHIFDEYPDGLRIDPFDHDIYAMEFASYAVGCNVCHTTFALGDLLSGNTKRMAREVPLKLHWSASNYLEDVRPDLLSMPSDAYSDVEFWELLRSMDALEAPTEAVTLGVSCESCHLGCREHVQNPDILPKFFPNSPHLRVESATDQLDFGRTHTNVNWACGRCHTGNRPQLAAGMSTWNSTEYSDAMRGSCYSELRCIDCHSPHEATGRKWSLPPEKDDALCIRCHQKYDSAQAQAAHSHHVAGSEGSRCMNCHMPRLNEGMQDVVRTHTIFSPTNSEMIHKNHPNACNQCHAEESIDWTVDYLGKWYGSRYKSELLDEAYTDRKQPAPLGWLHSENESVRLLGADTLIRTNSRWALDDLIGALDDRFLLNRQFARRGLETMLGVRLEDYGYRHYMTPKERKKPIAELRKSLVPSSKPPEKSR